jgi:hypothetical protein
MINLAIGFAAGFGAALYTPTREYVVSIARRVIAYFSKPKE